MVYRYVCVFISHMSIHQALSAREHWWAHSFEAERRTGRRERQRRWWRRRRRRLRRRYELHFWTARIIYIHCGPRSCPNTNACSQCNRVYVMLSAWCIDPWWGDKVSSMRWTTNLSHHSPRQIFHCAVCLRMYKNEYKNNIKYILHLNIAFVIRPTSLHSSEMIDWITLWNNLHRFLSSSSSLHNSMQCQHSERNALSRIRCSA